MDKLKTPTTLIGVAITTALAYGAPQILLGVL